jgi:hypothetical protein
VSTKTGLRSHAKWNVRIDSTATASTVGDDDLPLSALVGAIALFETAGRVTQDLAYFVVDNELEARSVLQGPRGQRLSIYGGHPPKIGASRGSRGSVRITTNWRNPGRMEDARHDGFR